MLEQREVQWHFKGSERYREKERLLSAERIIWGSSSIIKYTICSCVNVWMLFYFIFMSFALFWNTHIYACFPCGTAIRVAGSSGDISSSTSRSFQRKLLKSQYDDARLWYSRWKKVILQNFFGKTLKCAHEYGMNAKRKYGQRVHVHCTVGSHQTNNDKLI